MSSWDPTAQSSVLEWALRLHGLGLSMLPILHGSKKPAIRWEEFQHRQPTEEELAGWFRGTNHQLAIVCGEVSGVIVIDTDSAEAEIWARQNLPETPLMAQTPKGWHRYYKWAGQQVRNKARIKTGIEGLALDIRGDGGYVLAPGSLHPSGSKYLAWGRWSGFSDLPSYQKTWEPMERARLWMAKREPAVQGSGGDAHTYTTACNLFEFGLAESQVLDLMTEWNARCSPPWKPQDLAQKVRNASRYATNSPGCKLGQSVSGVATVRPKAKEPAPPKGGLLDKVYPLSHIYRSIAEARQAGTDTRGFVYSGIPAVDNLCKGFRPRQLVLIGARPSMGKTAFGLQMARSISRRFGPVYFESLEMGAEEMGGRSAQQALQQPEADLTVEQLFGLAEKADEPVFISEAGKDLFRQRVEAFLFDHPATCAIFVDYLGYLMKRQGERAIDEVSAISQMLKEMAKEYNLPVFAMAQLGRENEKEKRPPSLTDLRDSGTLEQDADKVLFIHRDRYEANGEVQILVAKNRGGPTGIAYLTWKGSTTTFMMPGTAAVEKGAAQQQIKFEEQELEAVGAVL